MIQIRFSLLLLVSLNIVLGCGDSDKDEKTERLKEATKKGIFAIAIAYFAKVDLVITPFWIVWTAVYFSHGWV